MNNIIMTVNIIKEKIGTKDEAKIYYHEFGIKEDNITPIIEKLNKEGFRVGRNKDKHNLPYLRLVRTFNFIEDKSYYKNEEEDLYIHYTKRNNEIILVDGCEKYYCKYSKDKEDRIEHIIRTVKEPDFIYCQVLEVILDEDKEGKNE